MVSARIVTMVYGKHIVNIYSYYIYPWFINHQTVVPPHLRGTTPRKGFEAARLHHRRVELRRDLAQDGALAQVRAVDLRIPRRPRPRPEPSFGRPEPRLEHQSRAGSAL